MSLVYITTHDENIYNFDKFDRALEEENIAFQIIHNPNRYISKYHDKVIKKTFDIISTDPYNKIVATRPGIGYHRTMGHAHEPLKSACDFLHKNEGIKWKKIKEHICEKAVHPMPAVPKVSELFKKKPNLKKNLIKKNIENIKNATIRQPKPKFAFSCRGETRELCNSGIMPAHIFSPNFGKLPNYILKYNKKLCDNQQTNIENIQKQAIPCDYHILDPEERIQILEGLKKRWDELQKIFQTLPVCTDIALKIQRKSRLEKQLKQLEEDILLVQHNPYIYICH